MTALVREYKGDGDYLASIFRSTIRIYRERWMTLPMQLL